MNCTSLYRGALRGAVIALAFMVLPAAAHAAGPPPPLCEPEGNYCVTSHTAPYHGTITGSVETVAWKTDVYSGAIVSATPSLSAPTGDTFANDCLVDPPTLPATQAVTYTYWFQLGTQYYVIYVTVNPDGTWDGVESFAGSAQHGS